MGNSLSDPSNIFQELDVSEYVWDLESIDNLEASFPSMPQPIDDI